MRKTPSAPVSPRTWSVGEPVELPQARLVQAPDVFLLLVGPRERALLGGQGGEPPELDAEMRLADESLI